MLGHKWTTPYWCRTRFRRNYGEGRLKFQTFLIFLYIYGKFPVLLYLYFDKINLMLISLINIWNNNRIRGNPIIMSLDANLRTCACWNMEMYNLDGLLHQKVDKMVLLQLMNQFPFEITYHVYKVWVCNSKNA